MVHEFGHFFIAKRLKVKVERFALGFGPKLLSKQRGDTEYVLCAIPLGGYVKMAGDSLGESKGEPGEYLSKTPSQRAAIIFCGPLLNYILGLLCFWIVFFTGYPALSTKVGGLLDGFGAKESGVAVGDKIIAVDGQNVVFWEDFQRIIQAKKHTAMARLSIMRDGKETALDVRIKEKEVNDLLGQVRRVGLIGITPSDETIEVRHGFIKSFILSVDRTRDLTVITYSALWRLICGKLSVRESMTGPLGIYYITSKAAHSGISAVLHLIAALSVSLAIFNLLPLPVLDGSHLLLLVIEKIRGKGISLKTEQVITHIGMTMLIFLAVIVTYNDVLRFFGDKIAKFLK